MASASPGDDDGGGTDAGPEEADDGVARRRRRPRWLVVVAAVAAVVVVTAGIGAWAWFAWLPHHRPDLRAGERYGVDVSSHQGEIDWERVAGDDIAFAYVKATEGGDFVDGRFRENWAAAGAAGLERGAYHFFTLCRPGVHQGEIDWERVAGDEIAFAYVKATEGGDFVDGRFRQNWAAAGAAGLERGAYHFFTLCRLGADQADHFLATVPVGEQDLAPVLDLELAGNCAERPGRDRVEREVRAFLSRVEEVTGAPVVLYVGDDIEDVYGLRDDLRRRGPGEADRPVWHRRLHLRPDVEGWWMWQVSDRAAVAGIDGGVDLDVMRPDDGAS